MVDVTWVEYHGLMAVGHDHDPDGVLAAAAAAVAGDTDLNPLARRVALPPTALPHEAWYTPERGFVQETFPGAIAVTVVDLPPAVVDEATRSRGTR